MATSRPIQEGDRLTRINDEGPTGYGAGRRSAGDENTQEFVLQDDFGLTYMTNDQYRTAVCDRVFGVPDCANFRDPRLAAAITNGTAPGLYVREGDDTSNWEVYREVLARRVEEAVAARRGGEGGVGAGERPVPRAAVRRFGPGPRMCSTNGLFIGVTVPYHIEWSGTAMFYVYSDGRREQTETTLEHCLNSVRSGSYVELDDMTPRPSPVRVQATPTATRQDDEIRVGDVVEVVSCRSTGWTTVTDVGTRGRVTEIDESIGTVQLESYRGQRLPQEGIAGLADVRKVSSPLPSPQTVAASFVDDMRRAAPRDFTATGITGYLQSLGATHIRISQAPGAYLPVIEVTGLSQQAFDTARQNLPVGVQLRAAGDVIDPVVGVYLGPVTSTPQSQQPPVSVQLQFGGERETTASRIRQGVQRELDRLYPPSPPQPPQQPPPPPSRFSLLEVDVNTDASPALAPQAPKPSTGLAALQQELRAEREAKRALAAAQTPPGRFDLLECDLPAVPVATTVKALPQRPVVSSSPKPQPKTHNPVETITDLTTARSPLELARMLEGLNDELSTMMRQREAN